MKRITVILGVIASGLVLAPSSYGAVIAEESFEDYATGALLGQGIADSVWAGPWTGADVSEVVDVSADPLQAGLLDGGNKAVAVGWGQYSGHRDFATALDPGSAPVYMSYLVRVVSGVSRQHIWNTDGNWDHYLVGIQNDAAGDFVIATGYKNVTHGGPQVVEGTDLMIVTRITDSEIKLWINPTSESDTPAVVRAAGWNSFDGVGLTNRGDSLQTYMDRIIVGETFGDVNVLPEPATLALLGLGGLGVILRRKK